MTALGLRMRSVYANAATINAAAIMPPHNRGVAVAKKRPRLKGAAVPEAANGAGPLDGVTVLDLTWVLAGPYASMILTDLGADVIKVERPPHGDVARTTGPFVNNESIYFQSINRGKRSMAVDLKDERGKALFLKLVERVDVVMENFTPGTMERLGLGYEVLAARNPRIIYAATSGFGHSGPLRERRRWTSWCRGWAVR